MRKLLLVALVFLGFYAKADYERDHLVNERIESSFKSGIMKANECHLYYEGYVMYFMTKDRGISLDKIYAVLPKDNSEVEYMKKIANEVYEYSGNDRMTFMKEKYQDCFNKIKQKK